MNSVEEIPDTVVDHPAVPSPRMEEWPDRQPDTPGPYSPPPPPSVAGDGKRASPMALGVRYNPPPDPASQSHASGSSKYDNIYHQIFSYMFSGSTSCA